MVKILSSVGNEFYRLRHFNSGKIMSVSVNFFKDALTPTSYLNMALTPNVLFSMYVYLKYSGSISNTVNFYTLENALQSSLFLPVSSVIIMQKVNFSKITFSESLPITYTIHIDGVVYQYSDTVEYDRETEKANLLVLPILYGQVGIV